MKCGGVIDVARDDMEGKQARTIPIVQGTASSPPYTHHAHTHAHRHTGIHYTHTREREAPDN